MKKLMRFFGYFAFFIAMLMVFIPKSSFYFYLEHELEKFNVVIDSEKLDEHFATLEIRDANIYFQGIDVAHIKQSEVGIFMFYNFVQVQDIELADMSKTFFPPKIQNIDLSYSVLTPLELHAIAQGDFGSADVVVNILDRNLSVVMKPSKMMLRNYRNTLREMRKNKNGEYSYAQSF